MVFIRISVDTVCSIMHIASALNWFKFHIHQVFNSINI